VIGPPGHGPRPANLPLRRGAVDFGDAAGVSALLNLVGDAALPPVTESAADPFVGVTTDGVPLNGLYELADEAVPAADAAQAACIYLAGLAADERARALLPLGAAEWRLWINAFLTFPEHGLLLQELSGTQLESAMAVIEASLAADGFGRARQAMRLNGELGQLVGAYPDTLAEYCYWFTIFGEPSPREPWGWQLQGHHVDLHCVIVGGQMVVTPAFLGVEFGGETVFAEHQSRAREMMESLSRAQRERALLYPSMHPGDLPHELAGAVDGRHRAGAGRDNLILPYAGLAGEDLTAGQRELLLALTGPYLEALPGVPRARRRAQVARYLDQTCFAWIGTWDEGAPFYYRVHSPVLLVEYDNHPGIFLDNDEPEPFHVHTIVRTPNGGDYGKDLLRQHYARHHPLRRRR
jgi:hypothetical protein